MTTKKKTAEKGGPPATTAKRTALTQDLQTLDSEIVRIFRASESNMCDLYVLFIKAIQRELWLKTEHANMVEYLMDRLNVGRRGAQQFVATCTTYMQSGLDPSFLPRLGTSITREIMIYARAAQPTKKALVSVVERIIEKGTTVREFVNWASNQIEKKELGKSSAKSGTPDHKEPKKSQDFKASDSQMSSIRESASVLKERYGTDDVATIVELTLADQATSVGDDPGSALDYARRQLNGVTESIQQASNSAFGLIDGGPKQRKAGEELMEGIFELTLESAVAMGDYITPDVDVDPKQLAKLRKRGSKAEREAFDRRAFNVAMLLLRVLGADDAVISRLEAIRPTSAKGAAAAAAG